MTPRLLLVDDEIKLLRMTRELLEKEGYLVRTATSPQEAYAELHKSIPDLLILDVRLPEISGFDFCKNLRTDAQFQSLPIIFLTEKMTESDKVLGLELGGDDYITKPFSSAELLARIKAVLRRHMPQFDAEQTLRSGPLTVKPASHIVEISGERLDLPPKEFDLLCLFLKKKGRVLTRAFLMESVWGQEYVQSTRTVDTHIHRLREDLGKMGDCIETVEGTGYKWEDRD